MIPSQSYKLVKDSIVGFAPNFYHKRRLGATVKIRRLYGEAKRRGNSEGCAVGASAKS